MKIVLIWLSRIESLKFPCEQIVNSSKGRPAARIRNKAPKAADFSKSIRGES
jgi:hypothetical protein